jgi:acetyl esterase/lipase
MKTIPHHLAMVVLGVAVLGVTASWTSAAEEVKSFVYKKTPQAELALTTYLPEDWKPEDRRPAIVFFFGGGWTNGKTTQFEPQAKHLAGRGMVAMCADYRVKSRHGVKPDACVEDAKSAIRWVRQHAKELGVDPERIVAAGGSAGGHLAACTGICPGLDAAEEDRKISSKPSALVLFNPALDFSAANLAARVGGDEKLVNALSPTKQLAKDSPPALLLFGTSDPLLAQGEAFVKRSQELGHHAEMFLAEDVGHGFFNRAPWLEKTTQRMDEFLVAQGYLSAAKVKSE